MDDGIDRYPFTPDYAVPPEQRSGKRSSTSG
jgi:hypothetical protein